MSSTVFICILPQSVQEQIRQEIFQFLLREGYTMAKIKEITENAMDGRLCDLEDNINIRKYLGE